MKLKTKTKFNIVFFVAAALISAKVYAGYRSDIAEYNNRISELNTKIDNQKQYGEQLEESKDIYSSRERVEQIARDTLGLVNSNERFFKNYNDNH